MVFLLAVLVVEGHARYFYNATLTSIEEAVRDHRLTHQDESSELPIESIEPLIEGFAQQRLVYRGDKPIHFVTYFSLFRTYAIRLKMFPDGGIDSLETGDWDEKYYTTEPQTLAQMLERFRQGVPREPGYGPAAGPVVQLGFLPRRTWERERGYDRPPCLHRELFRQALLIAARHELGLPTRDVNFGESLLRIQRPDTETAPLQLFVRTWYAKKGYQLSFERGAVNVYLQELEQLFVELPDDAPIEQVTTAAENLSRKTFVAWLKQAGFSGKPGRLVPTGEIPDAVEDGTGSLTATAQLVALRNLHESIHQHGESPDRIVALSGAYALYGALTRPFLHSIPDAAQARALLYAERLVQRSPELPLAYFGRARVRTLIGLHAAALADIEQGRTLMAKTKADAPIPRWVETLETCCRGDAAKLRTLSADDAAHASLATLLRLQLALAARDAPETRNTANRLLALEAGQFFALDTLMEHLPSDRRSERIVDALEQCSLVIGENGRHLSGLSGDVRDLLLDVPTSTQDCVAWRESLDAKLAKFDEQIADGLVKDSREPALSALAGLSRESAFLQAVRTIKALRPLRGTTPQERIDLYRPLVEGHEFRAWFYAFSPSQQAAWDELKSLGRELHAQVNHWNRNCTPLVALLQNWIPLKIHQKSGLKLAEESTSAVLGDLAWRAYSGKTPKYRRDAARRLTQVAPHCEAAVVWSIRCDWETAEPNAEHWEKQFRQSPQVQKDLGWAWMRSMRYADAERCYRQSLKLRPHRRTLELLAQCLLAQGDEKQWLHTMEQVRSQSEGLSRHRISSVIAYELMQRGRTREALPYAEHAAASYSKWGMLTLARCYETMGDFSQAEKYTRRAAEEYDDEKLWYFWCRRTGHGDSQAARDAIDEAWYQRIASAGDVRTIVLHTTFCQLDGDLETALNVMAGPHFELSDEGGVGPHLQYALLQLEHGKPLPNPITKRAEVVDPDVWRRGRFRRAVYSLNRCEEFDRGPPTLPRQFIVTLRRHFTAAELQPLNLPRLDWIVRTWGTRGYRTDMLYFIGKSLLLDGRKVDAVPYLRLAATSDLCERDSAILAGNELQKLGIQCGPRRSAELDSAEAKLIRLFDEAKGHGELGEPERAVMRCEEIVATDPDWSPAHFYLSKLRLSQGDVPAAIEHCNDLIDIEPELSYAWLTRGIAHQQAGKFALAADDYAKALALEPREDRVHWLLGMIRAASPVDELRDGAAALRHAEAIDPLNNRFEDDIRELTAAAYAELGDFENAVSFARRTDTRTIGGMQEYERRIQQYEDKRPYRLPDPGAEAATH